ncbi:hypothetical protein OAF27_02355 [Verrucomicrobiales bacterium]|nr:hypothetical protein [Verrucomicrobiales bacterium]
MKTTRTLALTFALSTLLTTFSLGQGPRGGRGNETPPIEVGSQVADVTAYDATGQPFALRKKIKDRPAVIVFGCLT